MQRLNRDILRRSWRSWVSYEAPKVGPYWLQLVWTFLFSAALAVIFAALGLLFGGPRGAAGITVAVVGSYLLKNLFICLVVGYLIHGLCEGLIAWLGRARIRAWAPWRRSLFFGGVPLVGVVVGWPIAVMLLGGDFRHWMQTPNGQRMVLGSIGVSLLVTMLLHQWFAVRTREIEAQQRATEAQLRLLQGQIEPHFLFNTLAGVISLIDDAPQRAKGTLQAFTDYLRGSLGALRLEQATLQQELDLAENYLRLMQARMEDRLRFRIEASPEAGAARVPPLLLQPLVENAVLHGLEPSIAGGEVVIRAAVQGTVLRIEVVDDGCGLDAPPRPGTRRPNGMALANIRERIRNRHGEAARLVVEAGAVGTVAILTLPYEPAA